MSYSGNADGKPIYPNEIDHGYAKPIEGDTGVMKQLVRDLRYEQGQAKLAAERVASRFLAASSPVEAERASTGKKASTVTTAKLAKSLAERLGLDARSAGSMGWSFSPKSRPFESSQKVNRKISESLIECDCYEVSRKNRGGRVEISISGSEDIGIIYNEDGGKVDLRTLEVFDD